MAPTRALLALLVVLTVGTGVAMAVSGEPVLSAELQSGSVAPGEDTTLELTVLNNGSVDVGSLQNPTLTQRVTTARGLKIRVDKDDEAPITVHSGTLVVGSLPEGGAAPLRVPVTVDEDVDPGEYRVPINVSYRYTSQIGQGGVEETESVFRTLNVTLDVQPDPSFRLGNVTTPVRAGTTDTLSVTVENDGGAIAEDTSLTLTSRSGGITFQGAPSVTRFVGDWPAGETRTVEFEVTAAPGTDPPSAPLELQATYDDRDGSPAQSGVLPFSVTPAPAQPFAVANVTGTLSVGGEGAIAGTITNTGSTPVRDAVVVFADDRPTITPLETEYAVGTLAPNESAAFEFPIQVSDEAEAGPRQFSILGRYRAPDDAVLESPTIDVRTTVGPKVPAFAVAAPEATIQPGRSGQLNVTLTNNGDETYTDISAKLFAESPLATSDDEAFVAELQPGESRELTFGIAASGSALVKDYPVSLDFRYDDADGDTQTSDTYRLPVTVVPTEDQGGPPYLLIAVVVLALLAVVGYYYWTRR